MLAPALSTILFAILSSSKKFCPSDRFGGNCDDNVLCRFPSLWAAFAIIVVSDDVEQYPASVLREEHNCQVSVFDTPFGFQASDAIDTGDT